MSERIKNFLDGALGYIAVAVVSLAYIAAGLLVFGVTHKPLGAIIAEGASGFVLGIAINFNMKLQGVLKGKRSEQMEATRVAHGEAVDAIAPHIDRLDEWCIEQNAAALRRERGRILTAEAMRYDEYFDADGLPLEVDFSKLPEEVAERRCTAFEKALRYEITPLSAAALTGDGERPGDPFFLGETPEEYQKRTNLTDMITKVLIALCFGYFGVDMVESFDAAQLVWRALYVGLLLALGVTKLVQAYLFVTDNYRGSIVKRINYLQAFKNWAEKNPAKKGGEQHEHSDQYNLHS